MGNHKYIESPEKMWELFLEYKYQNNSSDSWVKIQYVGKDGDRKTDSLKPPLTLEGFQNYVANKSITSEERLPKGIDHYFINQDKAYDEFLSICSRIKQEIREDQIIGGMLGFYNPSITQRLNGLTEKTESNITVEQPLFPEEPNEV